MLTGGPAGSQGVFCQNYKSRSSSNNYQVLLHPGQGRENELVCQKVNRLLHNKKYSCHGEQNMPVSKTGFLFLMQFWRFADDIYFQKVTTVCAFLLSCKRPCSSQPEGISCLTLTKLSFLRGLFYTQWVSTNKWKCESLLQSSLSPSLSFYQSFLFLKILIWLSPSP